MKWGNTRELVDALLVGDEPAWEHFKCEYEPYIRGAITKALKGSWVIEDIDDLVNDTYVKLLQGDLEDFRFRASLGTYITTVARNTTIDAVKRHSVSDLEPQGPPPENPARPQEDISFNPRLADGARADTWNCSTDHEVYADTDWYWADWMFNPSSANRQCTITDEDREWGKREKSFARMRKADRKNHGEEHKWNLHHRLHGMCCGVWAADIDPEVKGDLDTARREAEVRYLAHKPPRQGGTYHITHPPHASL